MTLAERAKKTDAECVEWARSIVINAVERGLAAKAEGADPGATLAAGRADMGQQMRRVRLADLRLVGALQVPDIRLCHWVYRSKKDADEVYIIGYVHYLRLQETGFTETDTFVSKGSN